MNNLVIKYYTLTDPLTAAPTKDVGYSFTVEYPDVEVTRVDGVPTIIKDTVGTLPYEVFPKYGPYVQVNKATYDAAPTAGESLTMTEIRTQKLRILEKHALANLSPSIPPENLKTLGQIQRDLMVLADTEGVVSIQGTPGGDIDGGELP